MRYKPYKTVVKIWDGNMNGGLCRYLQAMEGLGYKVSFAAVAGVESGDILFNFSLVGRHGTLNPNSITLGTRIIFLHNQHGQIVNILKMTQEEAENFLVEEGPVDKNTFWCEVAKSANKQQQELEDALRAICLDLSKAINKKD
jgi:hypothetical protein